MSVLQWCLWPPTMTISGPECEKHNIQMSTCWKGDAPYSASLLCWSSAKLDKLMSYTNLLSLYCYHNFHNAICNLTLDLENGAPPFELFFLFFFLKLQMHTATQLCYQDRLDTSLHRRRVSWLTAACLAISCARWRKVMENRCGGWGIWQENVDNLLPLIKTDAGAL